MSLSEKIVVAAIKIAEEENARVDDLVGSLISLACVYGKKRLGVAGVLSELGMAMIIASDNDEGAMNKAIKDMRVKAALKSISEEGETPGSIAVSAVLTEILSKKALEI